MKFLKIVEFTVPLASTASEVLMATAGGFGSGGVMWYRIVHGLWTQFHNSLIWTPVWEIQVSSAQRCPCYKGGNA